MKFEYTLFMFGVIIGVFIAFALVHFTDGKAGSLMVKHGCAQYNQVTGDFEWKDEATQ